MPELGDWEAAREAIAWVKGYTKENDFLTTVKDLIDMEDVPARFFGYVAGVVPFYINSKKREVAVRNEYFGREKMRCEMTLTLLSKQTIDGYYGITYLHKFLDDKSRMVVWFATNDPELPENTPLKVKATIKGHDEFNGVKQTKVNRLTVL